MSTTVYSFGEWLPDQPEQGDHLTVARNVLPLVSGYAPYRPLDTSGATLPGTPGVVSNAFYAFSGGLGSVYAYSGSNNIIYESASGTSPFTARGTASGIVVFSQYENLALAVGNTYLLSKHTLGSTSNFSTLSAATLPFAESIGVVNQFIVIGNLTDGGVSRPNTVRWNSIDQPANWPAPNSATAIASQAGEQDLHSEFGDIKAIHGTDQHAIILQRNAVTRMTYVGPPAVFQFDVIDKTSGSYFERGSCQVGGIVYFISDQGLCRTDGVTVERVGKGKVDKFFWDSVYLGNQNVLNMGYEVSSGLLYIAYNTESLSTDCDRLLIYNPANDRFTYANQDLEMLLTQTPEFGVGGALMAFGAQGNSIIGKLQGTAGSATIETGDIEINPGGRAYVDGVKPNVESSSTAPAVTVRVGSRNDLGTTPSYTATTTPTTRTGYADFRVDAKYHRAEVQIVGNFKKATGLVIKSFGTGEA